MARLKGTVVETGQAVHVEAPRRRKRKKGWRDKVGLIDLEMVGKLQLTGLEYRTLIGLMSFVPEKGGVEAFCTQQELADKLGIHQPTVARVLKAFQERNIAFRVRQGKWRVSPWLMYNGDFDSWNAEAVDAPEPVWVRGVDLATGVVG